MGYLLGPTVGAACWRLTHRRTMKLIDARDREFYKRIVKNRVDPTAQSATNPVPDFYGLPLLFIISTQYLSGHLYYSRRKNWFVASIPTGTFLSTPF
jgi:import inner membrane translocase subunit TIM23